MWFCSTGNRSELTQRHLKFQALAMAALSASLDLACDCLQLFTCKGVKKENKEVTLLGGRGTLPLCAHGLEIKSLPQEWVP